MKTLPILFLSILMLSLSGCANDFATTNLAIAQANSDKFKAFGEAMAACKTEGCRIGISMAYATGAGDQKMIQPERTAEILGAVVPFASLGLQAFDMFYGGAGLAGTGSNGSFVITGDNNSLSGIGNNMEANGGSTVNSPYSLSNTFSWSTNNRDYNLGADGGGSVVDTGIFATEPATAETATVTE